MELLKTMIFHLTNRCNLKCLHCWVDASSACEDKSLTLKKWKSIVDEGKALGVKSIKLTGGEPLLYNDTLSIAKYIKNNNINCSIETNGTLIDENNIEEFKDCFDYIAISLDSPNDGYHDWFRQKQGSWKKALNGIKLVIEKQIPMQIIYTVTKENMPDIINMLDFCIDNKIPSIKINPVNLAGRAKNTSSFEIIDSEDYIYIHNLIDEYKKEHNDLHIAFPIPMAFSSLAELLTTRVGKCDICSRIAVMPNGDVSICGIALTVKELVLGNIYDKSLHELWENTVFLSYIKENIPRGLKGVCGICVHKNMCLGHCRAYAAMETNDILAPHSLCQSLYEKGLFPKSRLCGESYE